MAQTASVPEPLITGTRMELEEFIRRWEALPDLKNAELIEGTVFVSSPVGLNHGVYETMMGMWLSVYAAETPTAEAAGNTTYIMSGSAPQPDVYLRLVPGGDSESMYPVGAPGLVVEIVESSYAHDFGPKKALYQRVGVREYITIDTHARQIIWRSLESGSYTELAPDTDATLRSQVFPGLWLNPQHVWRKDRSAMLALLRQGLDSTEHQAFVVSL